MVQALVANTAEPNGSSKNSHVQEEFQSANLLNRLRGTPTK